MTYIVQKAEELPSQIYHNGREDKCDSSVSTYDIHSATGENLREIYHNGREDKYGASTIT